MLTRNCSGALIRRSDQNSEGADGSGRPDGEIKVFGASTLEAERVKP